MIRSIAFVVLLLAFPALAQAQAVSGVVLGADGEPLPGAEARLLETGPSVEAGADGRFFLGADTTGVFTLRLMAEGHRHAPVSLWFGKGEEAVDLTARLVADEDSTGEAVVTFADPEARAVRIAAIFEDQRQLNADAAAARSAEYDRRYAQMPEGQPKNMTLEGHNAVMMHAVEEIGAHEIQAEQRAAARTETDPVVRQARYVAYFMQRGLPPEDSTAHAQIAEEALAEVPPDSPFWEPSLPDFVVWSTGLQSPERRGDFEPYLAAVVERHPDPEVRAASLYRRLRRVEARGDEEAHRAAYAELVSRYPTSKHLRYFGSELSPDRPTLEGNQIPAFSVETLEMSGVLSDESLRGQTYLLDFWATWCAPCVAKLPTMAKVYDEFKDEGFTIVSLSLDDRRANVLAFRDEQFAMPWQHGFVEDGFSSEIADRFGILGIPKTFLVGPDGTILATGDSLEVETLRATVAAALAEVEAGDRE